MSPLGSAAGFSVQSWVNEGRGSVSPAFTHSWSTNSLAPLVPFLPCHSLYMITPGDSSGVAFTDAIGDIISMSSWLVAAISVTPGGRRHLHLLALLPDSCENWLSRTKESIWRNWRRLPQVVYSRGGTIGGCRVTFSKVFDFGGCLDYLTGARNRATFVTLLDVSPRLCAPVPGSLYNINNLHLQLSRLLDGQGVEPWLRDAVAAQKAALLRSGTAPRLNGEKEITKKTLPPSRRPGGSGWRVLDVFRPNCGGFPLAAIGIERFALDIHGKHKPPRKLSTCTGRSYHKIQTKDLKPVYVARVSGYI